MSLITPSESICKLRLRTKIPCGGKCAPGEKFCNSCIIFKKLLREHMKQKKEDFEHPRVNFSLEEINEIFNCFESIKN